MVNHKDIVIALQCVAYIRGAMDAIVTDGGIGDAINENIDKVDEVLKSLIDWED